MQNKLSLYREYAELAYKNAIILHEFEAQNLKYIRGLFSPDGFFRPNQFRQKNIFQVYF
jgi:hypothetical protein